MRGDKPIVLLGRRTLLVPSTLEATLRQRSTPYADGWSHEALRCGLLVDLSRLEWVELEAVLQLCLLIESARRAGVTVDVALPLEDKTARERFRESDSGGLTPEQRQLVGQHVIRRRKVVTFLDYLQFWEALTPAHLASGAAPLRLLRDSEEPVDEEQFSAGDSGGDDAPDSAQPTTSADAMGDLPTYAFPLSWIAGMDDPELARLAKHMVDVVAAPERGTKRLEAATIADVVLYELVQNALVHSQAGAALVGAFAWSPEMRPRPTEYLRGVRGYMSWLASSAEFGVEVVVGDSGRGVANVLRTAYERAHKLAPGNGSVNDILAWAFDRDSTSKPQQTGSVTRGLYRVHRVVGRHSGLLTLRSADQLAGWDHGGPGHGERVSAGQRLSQIPGTLLRAQLCPIGDAVVPRPERSPANAASFSFCSVAVDERGHLDVQSRRDLVATLKEHRETCVVVAVASWHLGKAELPALLTEIADLRDPASVALVLDSPWDAIANACEAVNSAIDKNRRHAEEARDVPQDVSDPVLVLGARGLLDEVAWTGTTSTSAAALTALLTAPSGTLKWEELGTHTTGDDYVALRGLLQRDRSLFAADVEGVTLRVSAEAVLEAVAREVGHRLDRHLGQAHSHDVVRTRSLAVVRRWLSASAVVNEGPEEVAALAALSAQIRRTPGWADAPAAVVVADASASRRRLARLCEALGLGQPVIVPSERGSETLDHLPILDADARVLVFADVIASGESVRRCLTQLLRDRAAPIAVAALVDGRAERHVAGEHGPTVDFSGQPLPVVALANGRLELASVPPNVEPRNVGPGGRPEPVAPERSGFAIKPDDLLPLIAARDALHFRHVGEPGGRHFTFYVDAKKLLGAQQLRDALHTAVARWRDDEQVDEDAAQLEVWYPTPEPKPSEPAATLARELATALGAKPHAIRREPLWDGWTFEVAIPHAVDGGDVVLVDWGALDGTTLTQMIRLASEAGARRVLACVCLSQLPPQAEWHLSALRSIHVRQPDRTRSDAAADPPASDGAQARFDFQLDRVERDMPIEVKVPVEVRFLSALPVSAFGPRECPVCEQLARLVPRDNADDLSEEWARQRRKRLGLKSRQETVNESPIDVDRVRLTGAQAVEMLRFRRDLEAALRSTGSRYAIQQEIERLAEENGPPGPEALALLRFLAIETQWLRRPPIVLDKVSAPLAKLAAKVAEAEGVREADRGNAILVLQIASGEVFSEHLDAIFARVHEDEHLLGQLLYGVETLIERTYPHAEKAWQPLVDALQAMRERIDKGHVPQASRAVRDVRSLADRALSRQRRAAARALGTAQAWSQLKTAFDADYYRHGVASAVRRLYPYQYRWWNVDAEDDARRRDWAQLILPDSWERIERFLTVEVMPLLSRLRTPLGSAVVREALGREFAARLLDDLDRHRSVSRWELARIAREVSAEPRSLRDAGVRARYEREFDLLLRSLLDADDTEGRPSSGLIRLVAEVPAHLHTEVTNASQAFSHALVEKCKCRGVAEDDTRVLLPRSSVRALMLDVLENVAEHHVVRCGGSAEPAAVTVATKREGDTMLLTVLNTRTCNGACGAHQPGLRSADTYRHSDGAVRERESEGLAKHARNLAAFDGALDWGPVDDGSEFTFRVIARLAVSV
jgi:orotate phosphoribosyltransferase